MQTQNMPQVTHTVSVAPFGPSATSGSNTVEVKIKYPKEWDKEKFFNDGDIVAVSPETAEHFAAIGIIETEAEAEAEAEGKKAAAKK